MILKGCEPQYFINVYCQYERCICVSGLRVITTPGSYYIVVMLKMPNFEAYHLVKPF